jgi:hypothetical protein
VYKGRALLAARAGPLVGLCWAALLVARWAPQASFGGWTAGHLTVGPNEQLGKWFCLLFFRSSLNKFYKV